MPRLGRLCKVPISLRRDALRDVSPSIDFLLEVCADDSNGIAVSPEFFQRLAERDGYFTNLAPRNERKPFGKVASIRGASNHCNVVQILPLSLPMNDNIEWQFFNPHEPLTIVDRKLPHWSQAGVMSFITWRTNDSMPKAVVQKWHEERRQWLQQHLLLNSSIDYEEQVSLLPIAIQHRFHDFSSSRWHGHLDKCHGACVLRQPELARIVSDSLHYFDDKHYLLTDYVIMPNHVHLLVAFPDEDTMLKQCDSWKHFTATKINRLLRTRGRFWQQDAFDHLVRSEAQYQRLRLYLRNNPDRAHLKAGSFLHYSK